VELSRPQSEVPQPPLVPLMLVEVGARPAAFQDLQAHLESQESQDDQGSQEHPATPVPQESHQHSHASQ